MGTIVALDYEWKDMDDFMIKRPWYKIFKLDFTTFLNAIENRGICDIHIIKEVIHPLLLGKGLEPMITMKEFYEHTKIECNFMITEMNTMSLVKISHHTHPNWLLVDAIYCSCALPICFAPFIHENNLYCDGGFLSNLPIKQCIDDGRCMEETIVIGMSASSSNFFTEESLKEFNLFNFLITLLFKLVELVNKRINNISLFKEVLFDATNQDFVNGYDFINNPEFRQILIDTGKQQVIDDKIVDDDIVIDDDIVVDDDLLV
jgi:predicted acylesterase/phospholipase RssA